MLIVSRAVFNDTVTRLVFIAFILCLVGCGLTIYGLFNNIHNHPRNENILNTTDYEIAYQNSTLLIPTSADEHGEGKRNINTDTTQKFILGIVICVIEGIGECVVSVTIKCIQRDQSVSKLILSFWFMLVSLIISTVLMICVEYDKVILPSEPTDIMYLLIHVFTGGVGYPLWIYVVLLLSLITLGIVSAVYIPMLMVCQYVIARNLQPIQPGYIDFIGAVIISIGFTMGAFEEVIKTRCQTRSNNMNYDEDFEIGDTELSPLTKE